MFTKNALRVSGATLAICVAGQMGASALAQEDTIVVTGSIISGSAEDADLPIDVLGAEELQALGNPSPVELLKQLPSSSGVIGDTNQFDTRAQATEGQASVNLRGLGPNRTLVLLNNQRLATQGNFVDVNLLPQAAIGRIEVLKDGAAATYGSDAIAGVVNFFTRSDQEGLRVTGSFKSVEDAEGGGDYDISASYGFQLDRLSGLVAAGFQHRGELLANERDWSVKPYDFNPAGGFTGGGNPGAFVPFSSTVTRLGALPSDEDCTETGGFIRADSATPARCRTQFTPFDALVEEENRGQLWAELEYDISDDWTVGVTALYGRDEIPHYRSSPSYIPTQGPSNTGDGLLALGFPAATAAAVGGASDGFIVPATNPGFQAYAAEHGLPAGTAYVLFPTLLWRPFMNGGNPLFQGDSEFNRAGDDLGAQQGFRQSESTRFSADVAGTVFDTWDFNAHVVWHEYDRHFSGFDSFVDRVQLALGGFGGPNCDAATGTPGAGDCFYLNPFGNAYAENPALNVVNPGGGVVPNDQLDVIEWFFPKTSTDGVNTLFVAEASLSGGTGWELPGGEVFVGGGVQYRKAEQSAEYGDANNIAVNPCRDTPTTGNTTCSPSVGALAFLGTNADFEAENDVYAIFGEANLPVSDKLNVSIAARFEDYGGETGSTFDPKITARYQATDWLALRGSAGSTFRGPNPESLQNRSVTVLSNINNTFRPVDINGNPALAPESSTNYSAGLIFDFGEITSTVDYYRFEIEDQIISEPLTGMVDALFGDNGTENCGDPAFAGLESRFTFTADGCGIGNISRVDTSVVNGSELTFEGLDVAVNYERDEPVFGGFLSAGLSATYNIGYELAEQEVEGVVVQEEFDAVGLLNFQTTAFPLPEYKGTAFLAWGVDNFDARLTANYIDSYTDQRAAAESGPFRQAVLDGITTPGAADLFVNRGEEIAETLTYDLNLRFRLPNDLNLNATVFNLTNEDPSFAALEYNYDPFTGNPIGRAFKLGVSKDF